MGEETSERRNMISVIISTYQRPDRLKKAIKSVLSQSYQDFEIIVVDDRSKDTTKAVIEAFGDPRIHFIELSRHFGCDTKPKNEGIKASKGEYIAFLDDDNEYRPDHLAILLKEITQNDKLDIVYGDRWLVDETNRISPQLGIARDHDPVFLMQRNYIDTSDALVKRQALFDIGGFDERYKKYIDWNLWVRMDKYGKRFKHVSMILTNYHLHQQMKSETVKTKNDTQTAFAPEWDAYDCEIVLPHLGTEILEPKVAVYSLTYDRLEYTKKSFKSLEKTAGYKYDHFVVDNGSTDLTVEYLSDYVSHENLILNAQNVGISKASNQAIELIKKGKYDIVVKWDNDCIGLTKGWLAKMVEIWKSNRKIALSCYVQGLVDNPGGATRVGYGTLKGELVGVAKHLGGICHFVDIHGYDGFQWDDNSFLHGIQDMEFSQWLLFHGYTMGYLENFFVSHGPQGTAKQKEDFKEYFERRKKEKQTRYEANK